MDISHYISRLLFKYDCVIVPDFGGFITNYFPANYNKEQNLFIPPSKIVAFNSQLTVSDGILTNYIAQCNQISYSEASIEVGRFVEFVKNDLASGKSVTFSNIGSFKMQKGILNFTPDNSLNRLIDAFGLPVLQMPLSAQEILMPIFEGQASDKSIFKKVLVGIPIILALALIPMKMSNFSHQNISSTANFSNFQFKNETKQELLNNPQSLSEVIDKMSDAENALYYSEIKELPLNPKIDSAKTEISTTKVIQEEITKKDNPEINVPVKEIHITTKPDKKYYIIAGSFVEMSRVKVFCNELTSKDFNPEVVKRDGKLRIAVGSYNNSQEANSELNKFRTEHPDYPVWLLSI